MTANRAPLEREDQRAEGQGTTPRAVEDTHLSIEEKYDEVRQLITIGKEKGYLL